MPRPLRLTGVLFLAGLQLFLPLYLTAQEVPSADREPGPSAPPATQAPQGEVPGSAVPQPPPLPLGLQVEERDLQGMVDVMFYGPRVPRVHQHGGRRVTERAYYEIADDPEMARRARNHRGINIALGTATILSFFGGMVLFGAADQVDYTRVGLSAETRGRVLSLGLVAGSLAPAVVLMIRGPHAASLEYAYRTMERYNGAGE